MSSAAGRSRSTSGKGFGWLDTGAKEGPLVTTRTAPYVEAEEEFAEALNFLVSQVDGEPYTERLDVLEAMARTITREADSAREYLRAAAELRDWEAVGLRSNEGDTATTSMDGLVETAWTLLSKRV